MEFKMCPIQIRLHKLEEMSEMINFVSKVERRVLYKETVRHGIAETAVCLLCRNKIRREQDSLGKFVFRNQKVCG